MSKPNAPSRVSGAVAPDKTCPYDNPAGNRKCEVERAELGAPASLWEETGAPEKYRITSHQKHSGRKF